MMNQRYLAGRRMVGIAALTLILPSPTLFGQQSAVSSPDRRTLASRGVEREYFVQLPPRFDRDKPYWLLVVMGAVNGRNNFLATGISRAVAETAFAAIVVSPSSPDADLNAIRFPSLGEAAFLQEIVKTMRAAYRVEPKILLTGYSRGAQFAHRFAFAFPELVEAVAPLASGTWTTPDGRFLVEELGEMKNPVTFLAKSENSAAVPERLRNLFEPRVAAVAAAKAKPASRQIPFLVMCGTLDPRLPIAKEFVRSLEALSYTVEVEWPKTPHVCNAANPCSPEDQAEFEKYSRTTVEFFARVTKGK
jgi:poly(3-hydroxybutyrate) depolymerase